MKRNFGLDIVRSIAILFALAAHISPFFKDRPIIFSLLYNLGLYGVELFFVLTGFLIGQSILNKVYPSFSFKQIKKFYLKRSLRIMPLYYFVLICLILINNIILKTKSLHLLHFVFLQNFFPTEVAFFAVSWTLSIQFWFYLIIPIIFLLISKRKKLFKKLLKGYIIATLIVIIFRLLYVYFFNPTFDFGVRKNILLRFDSFFIGVLFAMIKLKYKTLYKKLSNLFSLIISIFLLIIFYLFYVYQMMTKSISYFDNSIILRAFCWPFISTLMLVFVSYLENSKFINAINNKNNFLYTFFTKLSIISFSMFLIHYEIYGYFENHFRLSSTFLSVFIPSAMVLALSFLLYNFVEKPILLKNQD